MTSQYVSQNGTLAAFKEGGKVTPPHPDLHQDEQVVWVYRKTLVLMKAQFEKKYEKASTLMQSILEYKHPNFN